MMLVLWKQAQRIYDKDEIQGRKRTELSWRTMIGRQGHLGEVRQAESKALAGEAIFMGETAYINKKQLMEKKEDSLTNYMDDGMTRVERLQREYSSLKGVVKQKQI